jgi:hydrogenase/urease accessory protein HupE
MLGLVRRPARVAGLFLFLLCLIGPGVNSVLAHPGNIAAALAKVQTDGKFTVQFRFDLLAYAISELPNHVSDEPMLALLDGPPADLDSRLTEAKERFRKNFRVNDSGPEAIDSITFPTAAEVKQSINKDDRIRLPVMGQVTVTGHLPPGARTIKFRFDEGLGTLVLTTEFPYEEPISEPVDAGTFSIPQQIPSVETVEKTAESFTHPSVAKNPPPVTPKPKPVAPSITAVQPVFPKLLTSPTPTPTPTATPTATPTPSPSQTISPSPAPSTVAITAVVPVPSPTVSLKEIKPAEPTAETGVPRWLIQFWQYIKMGYTHILPEGVDHILFVVGLFLLSTKIKSLLLQVTAFTVAHSLTLALSLYGIVHLPASFVEPVIAASIAFVAIENIFTKEMKSWRLAVVFGFGLIHGLGFAEALQELGLRRNNLLTALVGFNVGVELGQLSVVALAFVLLYRFREHPNYRKYVVIPASCAIALIAIYWMFQRIL